MCDIAAGEVLLAYEFPNSFLQPIVAVTLDRFEKVSFMARLTDLVHEADIHRYPFETEVIRLGVAVGGEAEAAAELERRLWLSVLDAIDRDPVAAVVTLRRLLTDRAPFLARPNGLMYLATPSGGADDFVLDANTHAAALRQLRLNDASLPRTRGVRIGIVDSGLAPTRRPPSIVRELNIFEWDNLQRRHVVDDGYGHGTRMATILQALAPDADYTIVRIFSDTGCSTDWHLIAALAMVNDCDVVNLSLTSQLARSSNLPCRDIATEARSQILDRLLHDAVSVSQVIHVASAGNGSKTELSYPSRFADVVAVTAVNSASRLSSFSDCGDLDQNGQPHQYVFAAPGGDHSASDPSLDEPVGARPDGSAPHWGTSCAAAYASAVVAMHLAAQRRRSNLLVTRAAVLDELKRTADRSGAWYDPAAHGNGIVTAP